MISKMNFLKAATLFCAVFSMAAQAENDGFTYNFAIRNPDRGTKKQLVCMESARAVLNESEARINNEISAERLPKISNVRTLPRSEGLEADSIMADNSDQALAILIGDIGDVCKHAHHIIKPNELNGILGRQLATTEQQVLVAVRKVNAFVTGLQSDNQVSDSADEVENQIKQNH